MAASVVGIGASVVGAGFAGLDVLPLLDPHAERANTPAAPTATSAAILGFLMDVSRRGRGVIAGYSPAARTRMGGGGDGECHASMDPSDASAAPNPPPIR
jgi:hypothetical protein